MVEGLENIPKKVKKRKMYLISCCPTTQVWSGAHKYLWYDAHFLGWGFYVRGQVFTAGNAFCNRSLWEGIREKGRRIRLPESSSLWPNTLEMRWEQTEAMYFWTFSMFRTLGGNSSWLLWPMYGRKVSEVQARSRREDTWGLVWTLVQEPRALKPRVKGLATWVDEKI